MSRSPNRRGPCSPPPVGRATFSWLLPVGRATFSWLLPVGCATSVKQEGADPSMQDAGRTAASSASVEDAASEDAASQLQEDASALRFVQLQAGLEGFCGITQGARHLRCVEGGAVTYALDGPFVDVSYVRGIAEDFSLLCAVRGSGELVCPPAMSSLDAVTPPTGSCRAVSVSHAKACALGDDGVRCWVPADSTPLHSSVLSGLSVSASYGCAVEAGVHPICFDDAGTFRPSATGHARVIHATAQGSGCAIGSPDATPTLWKLWCWDASLEVSEPLEGDFDRLSMSLDGHGCAVSTDGAIRCWGEARDFDPPAALTGPFQDVSVCERLACGLLEDGSVQCWQPR